MALLDWPPSVPRSTTSYCWASTDDVATAKPMTIAERSVTEVMAIHPHLHDRAVESRAPADSRVHVENTAEERGAGAARWGTRATRLPAGSHESVTSKSVFPHFLPLPSWIETTAARGIFRGAHVGRAARRSPRRTADGERARRGDGQYSDSEVGCLRGTGLTHQSRDAHRPVDDRWCVPNGVEKPCRRLPARVRRAAEVAPRRDRRRRAPELARNTGPVVADPVISRVFSCRWPVRVGARPSTTSPAGTGSRTTG
jgi:hypothetical protein